MPIRPTERALLKGAVLGWDIYEVYSGESEQEALDFLNTIPVLAGQYYVVVEVPNAIVARDRGGIYRPSTSWRGDGWVALKYEEVDVEGRKLFWPNWQAPAGQEQSQRPPKKKWRPFWRRDWICGGK